MALALAFFAGAFFGGCITFGMLIIAAAVGVGKQSRNDGGKDEK